MKNDDLAPVPPPEMSKQMSETLRWAEALVVNDARSYETAIERLKVVKSFYNRAVDFFRPMKKKADETKRAILDAERKIIGPLAQAEEIAKIKCLTYQRKQEESAEKERQRLQAIEDERARKEKERLEREAARLKSPEKKEERLEQAAAVTAPVVEVAAEIPKVAGAAARKTWKHEIIDLNKFFGFVIDSRRTDLVLPNEKVLAAYAKAMGEQAQIPGVRFHQESSLAIGGR